MAVCFITVVNEMLRVTMKPQAYVNDLIVTLDPVPAGSRARSASRFYVTVTMAWAQASPWNGGVMMIDKRGYPLQWQLNDVASWLVKTLNGAPCIVTMLLRGGEKLPSPYSPAKVDKSYRLVSELVADDVIEEAHAKIDSVAAWASSKRKDAIVGAADNMIEAAGLLVIAQHVQVSGSFGDTGET